jgi:hypothetical protein
VSLELIVVTERFDANGNSANINVRAENENEVYDIGAVLNRGNIPDFDKATLNGQNVTVVGISGPEAFPLGDVYFLLLYRDGDTRAFDAWGIMLPASSPASTMALRMAQQGYLPFRCKMVLQASSAHKGQEYWKLEKADAAPVAALDTK